MAIPYHHGPVVSRQDLQPRGLFTSPSASNKDYPPVLRPLSDIREITEPSIIDASPDRKTSQKNQAGLARQTSLKQAGSTKRINSVRIVEPQTRPNAKHKAETHFSSSASVSGNASDESSDCNPPQLNIPSQAPSSSRGQRHNHSINLDKQLPPQLPRQNYVVLPDLGRGPSPVRRPAVSSATDLPPPPPPPPRDIPPRTFTRLPCPFDILEHPNLRHSRVAAQLQVVAPVFVGGGTIEGFAQIAVSPSDWARNRNSLLMSRVAVDFLGIEEVIGSHRRSIFISLATELLDLQHPPPFEMVESTSPVSYRTPNWILKPSMTVIPFRINLPLDVGPAPFTSKTAQIRYMLSLCVHFSDGGRSCMIRQSQAISVLSTYDPERALRSLPSPLTAADDIHLSKGGRLETIRLTAGLHRQVWVSGTNLFVDVHIANNSHKGLKRLELSVERDILYYRHAAASTLEKSASQARIFQDKEQTILTKSVLKLGKGGWTGVAPHCNIIRTCEIDIPRAHATVRCGKFFEVRYFVNVIVGSTHVKYLSVQLPIILIHMNSLDVVPNAVGQVAAAIEERRAHHNSIQTRNVSSTDRRRSDDRQVKHVAPSSNARSKTSDIPRLQGKAFAAPRQQSLEQVRADAAEVQKLREALERSPRKRKPPVPYMSDRHRFALRSAPSSHSLGGLSTGSYTVLNGSNINLNIDGNNSDQLRAMHLSQEPGLSGTVRRTMRQMRSLDSLKRMRPAAFKAPYIYSHNPHVQSTDRTEAVLGLQLNPEILGLSASRQAPSQPARQRSPSRDEYTGGAHDRVDMGEPGIARRASRRRRGSMDRDRLEFSGPGDKRGDNASGLVHWIKGRAKSKSRGHEAGEDHGIWWDAREGGNRGLNSMRPVDDRSWI